MLGARVAPRRATGELAFSYPGCRTLAVHNRSGPAPRRLTVWLRRLQEHRRAEQTRAA